MWNGRPSGTAALAYEVVPRHLALGAETRLIWEQQGESVYHRTAKVGPALWFGFAEGHMHLTASALIGLTNRTDAFNPIVILAYRP